MNLSYTFFDGTNIFLWEMCILCVRKSLTLLSFINTWIYDTIHQNMPDAAAPSWTTKTKAWMSKYEHTFLMIRYAYTILPHRSTMMIFCNFQSNLWATAIKIRVWQTDWAKLSRPSTLSTGGLFCPFTGTGFWGPCCMSLHLCGVFLCPVFFPIKKNNKL